MCLFCFIEQVSQVETATSKKKRSTASSSTAPVVPPSSQPAEYFDFDMSFASQPKYTEHDIMVFDAEDRQNAANKKVKCRCESSLCAGLCRQ